MNIRKKSGREETDLDSKEIIYIRLLNECTDAYRPVVSRFLSDEVAIVGLPPDYDPEGEDWEFKPGERVEVEFLTLSLGVVPVAISRHEK